MIPLSVPNINGNEWQYVKDCLDTGWVSSAGKYVNEFEEAIQNYTGVKYAIACLHWWPNHVSHGPWILHSLPASELPCPLPNWT